MARSVARTPATSATRVRPGERISLTACRIRVSATSKTVMVPVATTTAHAATTTPLSASHHRPDVFSERGSGGGSPEGRRRLRTRWIAGGAGRGTGRTEAVPGSA
jgi:hypothetical protein